MENMRKPGSERAAQHPLQNSLPSKHSLKRKNSWDLDEMPVSVPDGIKVTAGQAVVSEVGICRHIWVQPVGRRSLCA